MGLSSEHKNTEARLPEVFEPCCGLYPGMASFTREFDETDYREWVSRSNGDPVPAPLILVVQNSVAADPSADGNSAAQTLPWYSAITREIQLQGALFDRDRPLEGVVFSPGITTGCSNDALYEFSDTIQNAFSTTPAAFARWCACFGKNRPDMSRLQLLRVLGFSKVRLCIELSSAGQDGDGSRREIEQSQQLLQDIRGLGYRSLAVDLMLPADADTWLIDRVERLLAETGVQCVRLITTSGQGADPSGRLLSVFRTGIMQGLGYRHLGLDWYVSESEPSLGATAPLHWSALGYTDIEGLDVIGAGPGAVSVLEDACSQNAMQREAYQRRVEQDEIPTEGGVELESDDSLRRTVMSGILVNEYFSIEALEDSWGIMFARYFESEMTALRTLEEQGKLVVTEQGIHTLERGRDTLHALCKIFDNQDRIARVPPLQVVD